MFNFQLWDGFGKKKAAGVTDDGEVCTIAAPYPPLVQQKVSPLRQYLTIDGTATGDNDMVVDGSVTPVEFCITADPDEDRYVTSLSFIVGYTASGAPYQWADGLPLTNGTRLFYTSARGEQDIHDAIKTNQDMFRLSFSPITSVWEVRHVNANNDWGYFITADITKMGLPFGIKLDRGSNQRLAIKIRDNMTTSTNSFNCISYGFNRFE